MTSVEASALLGLIEGQSCLMPQAHQIANGEWVVVVNHVYLWNPRDWERLQYQWQKSLYSWRRR